jgi:hypothetical protein
MEWKRQPHVYAEGGQGTRQLTGYIRQTTDLRDRGGLRREEKDPHTPYQR